MYVTILTIAGLGLTELLSPSDLRSYRKLRPVTNSNLRRKRRTCFSRPHVERQLATIACIVCSCERSVSCFAHADHCVITMILCVLSIFIATKIQGMTPDISILSHHENAMISKVGIHPSAHFRWQRYGLTRA